MGWTFINVGSCCESCGSSSSSSAGCTIYHYYAEKGTVGEYGYYGIDVYSFSQLAPGYRFTWHDISDPGMEFSNAGNYEINYLIATENYYTDQACDERRETLESLGYWI